MLFSHLNSFATETEAQSLGLKFGTGLKKDDTITTLNENHNFSYTEYENGLVLNILAANLTITIETTLPRRYIKKKNIKFIHEQKYHHNSIRQKKLYSYNGHKHLH